MTRLTPPVKLVLNLMGLQAGHVHTPGHLGISSNLDLYQLIFGLVEKEGIRLRIKGVIVVASTKDLTVTVRGP